MTQAQKTDILDMLKDSLSVAVSQRFSVDIPFIGQSKRYVVAYIRQPASVPRLLVQAAETPI